MKLLWKEKKLIINQTAFITKPSTVEYNSNKSSRSHLHMWGLKLDRSKAMLLLWLILIVNVRPLSGFLWLTVQFIMPQTLKYKRILLHQ